MLTEEMVRQAEARRRTVMLAADVAGMDRLFADKMLWVHASGGTDSKKSMLEKFAAGSMKYHSLKPQEMLVRVMGDCAVTNGEIEIDGEVGPVRKIVTSRYMGVWVWQDGIVRLFSWQSSRLG